MLGHLSGFDKMKKLLLLSDGLKSPKIKREFLKLLDKPAKENRILIMHTAKKPSQLEYVRNAKSRFVSTGIRKQNICEVDITKRADPKKFKDFDVFFSMGGNTFYILDRVRKTGFDKYIKDFVGQGKFYIGVSAGSILVGPDIRISFDENEIKLRNLRGLKLINTMISPHFSEERKDRINRIRKQMGYPIVELRDGQAFEIVGNKTKIIK